MSHNKAAAFTMLELILAIVVISIAVSGTLLAFRSVSIYNADPMLVRQSISIAKSYMDEILSKTFPTGNCASTPTGNRSNWNNICDFNGLNDNGAFDQFGNVISGLENYTVRVNVFQNNSANLQSLTGGSQVIRIDVTVSNNQITPIKLTSYKTNYEN